MSPISARPRKTTSLKTAHARVNERLDVAFVSGNDAAPERDVHVTVPTSGAAFRFERLDTRRRRNAVEGHVDDRRDAAGRRRARGRIEAFPVGAARLVDVHMRVDDAGRYEKVAAVDRIGTLAGRDLVALHDQLG